MYLVIFKRYMIGTDAFHNLEYGTEALAVTNTEEDAIEYVSKVKSGEIDIYIPYMENGKFEIVSVDLYE